MVRCQHCNTENGITHYYGKRCKRCGKSMDNISDSNNEQGTKWFSEFIVGNGEKPKKPYIVPVSEEDIILNDKRKLLNALEGKRCHHCNSFDLERFVYGESSLKSDDSDEFKFVHTICKECKKEFFDIDGMELER